MFEQLQLLVGLYYRPVKAASRIIDTGRLWFALCAALLVMAGLQAGSYRAVLSLTSMIVSRYAPAPEQAAKHPTAAVDEDDDEGTAAKAAPGLAVSPLLLAFGPSASLRALGAYALAFVPAVILVMTLYRSHESFPVLLRKDYLSFLNCALLSLAAAYLPVALVSLAVPSFWLWLGLVAAGQVYFLVLVSFCVRTMWGTGMAAAFGASLAGGVATIGGLAVFTAVGSFGYYLYSPFFLYYAYILLGSDIRSLGDGFRAKQHLRNQLDIATNNPRDADAHYQLGLIYVQRRQYDEAKARFARAVEIDPREADPIFQLGRIALAEERWDDAIELLNRAAALDDKCCSHEVWRELGVAYFQTSRLEEARLALAKYVDRRPYDPEGLYWFGKTLAALGQSGEAREQFEGCRAAVETMPTNRRRQLSVWKRKANAELRGLEKIAS